ncbi:MAG: PQQ-binding-like beta-propeller repeat protein [Planctomycetes bacterium]|nr:PQQ-binding-like beta-propeller repeat protein [Planctomycetota bacterium]
MRRFLGLIALCASAGSVQAATTVTLPRDAYFEGVCTEIREQAARGRWDRVGDVVRALAGAMDRVGPSTAVWISPSHGMGFWAAFQRILLGLPDDVRAQFAAAAGPVVRAELQRSGRAERTAALHRIARDLPVLDAARDAAIELLDLDIEEGRFDVAISRCERILARGDLDPRTRFSTLVRGLSCAAAAGDLERWRAWRPLAAAYDPGSDAAAADLRRRALALPAPATGLGDPAPAFLPGDVAASFSTGLPPGAGGPGRFPPFLPAADADRIYLPAAGGLISVDRRTRAIDWDVAIDLDAEGNRLAALAVGRDALFVRARGGVARIDPRSGRTVWRSTCTPQKDGPGLAWSLEGRAESTRASILTPPLLVEASVVVGIVADRDGELPLYISALSPDDGRPLWTTSIGTSHAENYLGLALGGAPLATAAGRVFFATGCGAIGCVDLFDGALQWVRAYPSRPSAASERSIRTEARWALCAPVPAGKTVIVAPQDADALLGLDAESGTILWSADREDAHDLVGVRDGKALVAGATIRAIAIEGSLAGRTAWARPAPAALSGPAGRGILTGPWMLLPGREGLLAIDAATGSRVSFVLWDRPGGGGNLLLLDDRLLVTGFTLNDLYAPRDAERSRLQDGPETEATEHLRRAKFAMKVAGGLVDAREEIARWRAEREPGPASPDEDRLRYEIVHLLSVWLDGGGLPPEEALDSLRLRMELEEDPGRKVAHAAALADALQRRADVRGALEAWHAVLPLGPDVRTRLDDRLSVAAMPYVRNRIVRLLEGRPDRADLARPYEERADKEMAIADRFATPTTYRRVIDAFPVTRAARRAYWRIAEIAGGQGAPRENLWTAFTTMREYVEAFPDAPDIARAYLRLADFLEGLGRVAESRAYLEVLARRAGDAVLPGGRIAADVVRERLALPLYQDVDRWRAEGLRLPLAMHWRTGTTIDNRPSNYRERILHPAGPVPPALHGAWLTATPFGRRCRDRHRGIVRWTYLSSDEGVASRDGLPDLSWPQDGPVDEGAFAGSLYVFHDGRTVLGLEAATGLPRWASSFEVSPPPGIRSVPAPRIAHACVTKSAVYVATFDKGLVALDVADGREIWRRTLDAVPAVGGGPFLEGDALLLLERGDPPAVLRIDPRDGSEAGRVPIEGLGTDAQEMIAFPGGAIVFLRGGDLARVTSSGAIGWTRRTGVDIRRHWSFDDQPDRIYILRGRSELAAIATATGEEIWAHPFPGGQAPGTILPEGDRVYVLVGEASLGQEQEIAALSIEPLPGGRRAAARELWRQTVGDGGGPGLLSARDTILYCDEEHRVVWAFDKEMGTQKTAEMTALLRFLRGKRPLDASIIDDTLVVLSDFGDAGFVADNPLREREREIETLRLARESAEEAPRIEALAALGQSLFRDGSVASAVGLVEDGLLREAIAPRDAAVLHQLIAGWEEEASERRKPIIRSRVIPAPRINGRLDEWWNPDLAVHLDGPARVLAVQAPTRLAPDWRGPEDLSATIYTGWDRDNIYLAVDVRDDHTQPHRRDDERYWVGDFLLIGLDPEDDGGYGAADDKLWTLALVLPQRNRKPGGRSEEETQGEFHVRAKDDDSGAVYEVSLPWSAVRERTRGGIDPFPEDPRAGQRLGLSLVIGDDDTGRGTTKIISLTPGHILDRWRRPPEHVWLGFIPERFPRLVLEGDPNAEGNR